MELGASTLGFRHEPLDVALNVISKLGFEVMDMCMIPTYCPHFDPVVATDREKQELDEKVKNLGLGIATLNVTDGLLGIPADREKAIRFAQASMDLAKMMGAYGVTIQSGVEPQPGQWLNVAKEVAADVRDLGNYAQDRGLELTLELHKQMLMTNTKEALDLMELVNHPSVGVALDPSHITYAGEKSDEVALKLGRLVKQVHLRDGIGQNILVVPGDGSVDFAALGQALRTIGYPHATVIELEYEFAKADQVEIDLKRAKAYLEERLNQG